MNLRNLFGLSKLEKQVIAYVSDLPLQFLLDHFNLPSESAVTNICIDIGRDPNDYYDRLEVYRSLKSIATKSGIHPKRGLQPTTQTA